MYIYKYIYTRTRKNSMKGQKEETLQEIRLGLKKEPTVIWVNSAVRSSKIMTTDFQVAQQKKL